ncbi:hypothetical protein PAMP_021619 [Pampus punctatissimus]
MARVCQWAVTEVIWFTRAELLEWSFNAGGHDDAEHTETVAVLQRKLAFLRVCPGRSSGPAAPAVRPHRLHTRRRRRKMIRHESDAEETDDAKIKPPVKSSLTPRRPGRVLPQRRHPRNRKADSGRGRGGHRESPAAGECPSAGR